MKTNSYLIEYAKSQIGKPYWFGTFGQTASERLYKEKKKQYPKYYTAKDFPSQYGQRVHDCVGLHNGALWSDTPTSAPKYNASQDLGANGLYNKANKKGKIASFDKVNGRLVFKGSDFKKTHVGVYVDGYVIEAKGHAYGVVKTKFNAKSWPYWAQSPFFQEKTEAKPEPIAAPSTPKANDEYKVIADDGLNIRKGKGTNYKKIGWLKCGSIVKISKKEGAWSKLKDRDGWVSSKYLKKCE